MLTNLLKKLFIFLQIIDLIKLSCSEYVQLSNSILYQEVSHLLAFWSTVVDDQSKKPLCDLWNLFWKLFIPECQTILKNKVSQELKNLQKFFVVLKNPHISYKKSAGVKFVDDEDNRKMVICPNVSQTNNKDINTETFNANTAKFLGSFIKDCYDCYCKENDARVYKFFATLLSSYPSKDVFNKLLESDENTEMNVSVKDVLESVVLPVMNSTDKEVVQSAIEIFIALYTQVSSENQMILLKSVEVGKKM